MNVKEEIQRAIKYGIYLGKFNNKEEKEFIANLFSHLIEKNNFCTLQDDDTTIVITSYDGELAEVFVHSGTLKIIPQASEGYFQVFMDVLEYLAKTYGQEEKEEKKVEHDESTEDDGEMWL